VYDDKLAESTAHRFVPNKPKTDAYEDVSMINPKSSIKEKYQDSALKFINNNKAINVLSVQDSLELEKQTAAKQSQVMLQRNYHRLLEHYNKINNDLYNDLNGQDECSELSDDDEEYK